MVRQLTFLRHLGDGPPVAGQTARATFDMLSKMANAKGPKKIRGETIMKIE